MTARRDFKARVRARMAITGEKYTEALRAIEAQRGTGADFDGVVREVPVAPPMPEPMVTVEHVGSVEVVRRRARGTS